MPWFTIRMIVVNTSFWLVLCFGLAWLVRIFPKGIYNSNNWFYREKAIEKKLYKTMTIAKWKDRLPEWGKALNFEKKHLKNDLSKEYIDQFILETCYAEVGHLGMALFGFACILVNPSSYALMAIILAVINFFVHIPFILIQRYNRPRLIRLRKWVERKIIDG